MAKVTLDLEGPKIPVERFLEAVEALLTLLREIDRDLGKKADPSLTWFIADLKGGSAHVGVAALPKFKRLPAPFAQRVISTAAGGISALERNVERRPAHFSDAALEAARTLTSAVGVRSNRQQQLAQVRIRFGQKHVHMTEQTAATVERLIGPRSTSLGSVEGRLEVISIHDREHFRVLDRVTGRLVSCYFEGGDLNTVMKMLGQRVAVFGILRSRATGEPHSIEVKTVEGNVTVLPDETQLPTLAEMRGILGS